ncbi:MAG: terminase family protein, partial [Pseudaminobacter sp.]
SLEPGRRAAVLNSLSDDDCESLLHDWRFFARDSQIAPPDAKEDGTLWHIWLILAGRGFGKTRTGSEWVREQIKAGAMRVHLIAPTASDARDVMVEGESGILSVCWAGDRANDGDLLGRPSYEPSKRRLTWANGAIATLFSAEEPERLRGPQAGVMWADELAAWKYLRETWDMAMFGLRLGDRPRVCITTTPKPVSLLRELIKDKRTVVTRGSTFDNAANLAPTFLQSVKDKYEGTRLGRQELHAELLEEAEGALWTRDMLEAARLKGPLPAFKRVVVAVDPAVTAKAESNLTGIVAAALGVDGRGYVLADSSGRYSPDAWARKAIEQFDSLKADRIVAEGNQGGDLVRHTLHSVNPRVPVTIVHATRGKNARAEPIAALYEQNRVSHAGTFAELEDQMATWEPLGDMPSPDRIDALVWALTSLMLGNPETKTTTVKGLI